MQQIYSYVLNVTFNRKLFIEQNQRTFMRGV